VPADGKMSRTLFLFCKGIVTLPPQKINWEFLTKILRKKTALGKQSRFPQGFRMSNMSSEKL